MAKITFIFSDNQSVPVEASSGTIMELAVRNNVKGIDGECGGVCSCGTCHVHVLPEFIDVVGKASDIETDLLELNDNSDEYSRLGCQINITELLDGISLKVAK